ncbi:MAG: hypothetical protein EYC71_04925 [Gammaproteobacteria bacterium]|nr:MAG: hypothetical protein EYC71_04925 [Gammaproteobacteria bacterium]
MANLCKQPLAQAVALALVFGSVAPVAAQDVDLGNLGSRGFLINNNPIEPFTEDHTGRSVSGAGDVNGDGLADLIVGALGTQLGGNVEADESYVVFGKADEAPFDLVLFGGGGISIQGVDALDYSAHSVSGAGDVNGDGLADLIVGAFGADPNGRIDAGQSYVVFGMADSTAVYLGNLGTGGFVIDGIVAQDSSGYSVSGAGDVNGDGLADLIIGAHGADLNGVSLVGQSYVVFGKADSTTVDLGNLGTGGFVIDGFDDGDRSGYSVSGAGDVNGDGLADLIIGAHGADPGFVNYAGESYVVFGKADSTTVDLGNLGTGGFVIEGINAQDRSGRSVSGAGDVNGDGLADLIVGAWYAEPGGNGAFGESYVVFGKTDSAVIDLGNLGSGGFSIYGIDWEDHSGGSVAGAGDVNGDGLADLIIGAKDAESSGNANAGESYVVFGKNDSATVDLATLGSGGFRLSGVDVDDYSGTSVSGAGDVNGDGLADLIIGAPYADSGANYSVGESYVVFSISVPLPSASVRARSANGNPPRTAIGISGDGSNDGTPDARAWIDFADGNDPVNPASLETVTLNRSVGAFSDSRASVHWQLQTTRQNWTAAELRLRYLDSELFNNESGLQIHFSPNGNAPFTPLPSTTNRRNNTISANITQVGYYFIGSDSDVIFADGFE